MPSETTEPTLADPPGWRIGRLLSCRNGVSVHQACDGDGRGAIVKRLDLGSRDPIARLRFERERRLARLLRHPGLATLLAEGDGWLAFERLGRSLADCRDAFALEAASLALLTGVAQTLSYLHGRGVVHQDLKPAHLLFRDDGRLVLVDLGAAGLVADDPLAGREAVGAPAWAAPEQLAGAVPAPAADLWSLGRIALWLAAEAGFNAEPAALGPLLRRCLDPDPGARPSAAELLETLLASSRLATGPSAL